MDDEAQYVTNTNMGKRIQEYINREAKLVQRISELETQTLTLQQALMNDKL